MESKLGKEENKNARLNRKCGGFLFVLFLIVGLPPIFNLLRSSVNLQERKIVFMSSIFFFF